MNEPTNLNVNVKQEPFQTNPARQATQTNQQSFPQQSFPSQTSQGPQHNHMPQQNTQISQHPQQGFTPHSQLPQQNPQQQQAFFSHQRFPQQQQQFPQQIPQQFGQQGILPNAPLQPQVVPQPEFSLDSVMDLINFTFYILSFETVIIPQGDVLPREIGIVACTISDGIKKQFEKIIEVHIPEM